MSYTMQLEFTTLQLDVFNVVYHQQFLLLHKFVFGVNRKTNDSMMSFNLIIGLKRESSLNM